MSTLSLYPRQWRLKRSEGKTVSTVFHLNNKEAKRELDVYINTRCLNFQPTTTYLGVKLDRTLSKAHQPIRCEPKLQPSEGRDTTLTKVQGPLCHKRKVPSVYLFLPNETKAHWIARMWSVEGQPSTSRLCEYITSPSRSCPGSDLSQQAWVELNRLHTGVGRFNAGMWR